MAFLTPSSLPSAIYADDPTISPRIFTTIYAHFYNGATIFTNSTTTSSNIPTTVATPDCPISTASTTFSISRAMSLWVTLNASASIFVTFKRWPEKMLMGFPLPKVFSIQLTASVRFFSIAAT